MFPDLSSHLGAQSICDTIGINGQKEALRMKTLTETQKDLISKRTRRQYSKEKIRPIINSNIVPELSLSTIVNLSKVS
jgi:hypothetical protein